MVLFFIVVVILFVGLVFLIYFKTNKKIKETQRLYSDSRNPQRVKLGDLSSYYGFGTKIIGDGYVAHVLFGLPIIVFDRITYRSSPTIEFNYGWQKETETTIYDAIRIPWDWNSLIKILSIYYGCAIVALTILCLCISFG